MSHITSVKTNVNFKNGELLSKAILNIPNGVVGTTIVDYYGKETTVDMSVKTPEFERGIGFSKAEDEVFIPQMDRYGYTRQADTLMNQIQTQYRTLAVQDYYESKGFAVEVEKTSDVESQVHIRGY